MRVMKQSVPILVVLALFVAAPGVACKVGIEVEDPALSGFGYAAEAVLAETLALNGCEAAAGGGYALRFTVLGLDAKKRVNALGLMIAGGVSSATTLRVTVTARMQLEQNGETVAAAETVGRPGAHRLFTGYRRARGIKKRAVEQTALELAAAVLGELDGVDRVLLPALGNSDIMNSDGQALELVGGFLAAFAVHEFGHMAVARVFGRNSKVRGNDTRTTLIGPEIVGGLSVLFAHRWGMDQTITILPDVLYDFRPVDTPVGRRWLDDQGRTVGNGRMIHAFASYGGILAQNLANEYILTRRPRLIEEDRTLLKGFFLFNILIPAGYPLSGWADPNSDLRLLQIDTGLKRWEINGLVLLPAALDAYRFYNPEKKKLRRWARVAKLLPLVVIAAKTR